MPVTHVGENLVFTHLLGSDRSLVLSLHVNSPGQNGSYELETSGTAGRTVPGYVRRPVQFTIPTDGTATKIKRVVFDRTANVGDTPLVTHLGIWDESTDGLLYTIVLSSSSRFTWTQNTMVEFDDGSIRINLSN
jgi:hypothetical protein